MKNNYLFNAYAETWLLESNIVVQSIKSGHSEVTAEIARQLVEDRKKVSENRPVLVLVETTNLISVDKQAREFYQQPEAFENIIAVALVMDNFIARMFGNLYFKLRNPPVPMELFNNKQKALDWLKSRK